MASNQSRSSCDKYHFLIVFNIENQKYGKKTVFLHT